MRKLGKKLESILGCYSCFFYGSEPIPKPVTDQSYICTVYIYVMFLCCLYDLQKKYLWIDLSDLPGILDNFMTTIFGHLINDARAIGCIHWFAPQERFCNRSALFFHSLLFCFCSGCPVSLLVFNSRYINLFA